MKRCLSCCAQAERVGGRFGLATDAKVLMRSVRSLVVRAGFNPFRVVWFAK